MDDWRALVADARAGDLAAFEAVVRRFMDMAVGYAYSVLGDFCLAEDAAQEAFVQAYYDLGTLREPQAFPSWLRRIVFKYCDRRTRRKRLPTLSLEATMEIADPQHDPQEAVQRRELQEAVLGVVNALPEHERTATALFYINGYSLAEVGEFLDVPVSTVKNRLHSARKHMRDRMVDLVQETLHGNAPDEGFPERVRHVLQGVPRVGFYRGGDVCPEDAPFPSSLAACLRHLGEDYPYLPIEAHGRTWRLNDATVYAMAISGIAYGLLWRPGWHEDNVDMMRIADDPAEIIDRSFEAVGYGYEVVLAQDGSDRGALFRRRIAESVRRGRPVMAFGVLGLPECCIITGYDGEGDVVIGWSFFQDDGEWGQESGRERSGYFRRRDWARDTQALIVFGDKRPRPSQGETNRKALRWALEVMRRPTVQGCPSGHAAYTAWADALRRDGDFPVEEPDVLRWRHGVHDAAVGTVAEGRWYASQFLTEMAKEEPAMAPDLLAAAACFSAEHDLMWRIWGLAGGHRCPKAHLNLADGEVRRAIATVIVEARERDIEAAAHIEAALCR